MYLRLSAGDAKRDRVSAIKASSGNLACPCRFHGQFLHTINDTRYDRGAGRVSCVVLVFGSGRRTLIPDMTSHTRMGSTLGTFFAPIREKTIKALSLSARGMAQHQIPCPIQRQCYLQS